MSRQNNYAEILLEQIVGQNQAVLEAVGGMQETIKTLATKEEVRAVADDVKIIKIIRAVVTATNRDVADHEIRLSRLEQSG